ncbi:MAG: hypothetical protein ABF651_10900 [Sporolactobacillus sp.]
MRIWWALFKKEWLLGGARLVPLLEVIVMILTIFAAIRWGNKDIAVTIGGLLVGMHLFYLVAFLLANTTAERRTFHLWLHNPQPGWKMLAAKLAAGIVSMIPSFFLAGIFTWISMLVANTFRTIPAHFPIYQVSAAVTLYIFWEALSLGIAFLFLWVLYRCLRSRIGKWVWLVMLGIIIGLPYLFVSLAEKKVFASLTHWGKIVLLNEHYGHNHSSIYLSFYAGSTVGEVLLMIAFFMLSAFLVDHYMEAS